MSPTSPIVVLDSGLGGLTVARAIRKLLPKDEIVYFGDTARLPYGSKSAATVTGFVKQIIAYLRPLHPKHIVIACNTATALALPAIRGEFPELSISGVIDPGARAAALHRRRIHAQLMTQATPLLAPIIEEGRDASDPLVRLAVRQYLCPLVDRNMDVLVLGCTHYPILADLIIEIVGPNVKVIDSAEQCAQDVAHRLRVLGLMRDSGRNHPSMRCFVTDDPVRFQSLGSRFLGVAISDPELVSIERLSESLREFQHHAGTLQLRHPAMRAMMPPNATGLVA